MSKPKHKTDCPQCGRSSTLAIIAASDGREWINCACHDCSMAMDEQDNWTLYVGGVVPRKTRPTARTGTSPTAHTGTSPETPTARTGTSPTARTWQLYKRNLATDEVTLAHDKWTDMTETEARATEASYAGTYQPKYHFFAALKFTKPNQTVRP